MKVENVKKNVHLEFKSRSPLILESYKAVIKYKIEKHSRAKI